MTNPRQVYIGLDGNNETLSNWVGAGGGGREILTANRTYFVATTGNDSNDGLSSPQAFLTVQKAIDVVAALDADIYDVTIQIEDGTYLLTSAIEPKDPLGSGSVTIQGNSGNRALVVLDGNGASQFVVNFANPSCKYEIKDLTFRNSTEDLVRSTAFQCSSLIRNCDWNTIPNNFRALYLPTAETFVRLRGTHNVDCSGITTSTAAFFTLAINAHIDTNAATINIAGTPTFSSGLFVANRVSHINVASTTVTGTWTGFGLVSTEASVIYSVGSTIGGGTSTATSGLII